MRIRIKFCKYGSMRFVGHLDTMRYFQKAMRRANIDIAYTEGFSPHQIMSFASPLGVGITSEGEYFDIEVRTTLTTRESVEALNDVMVEGIRVLDYVALREDSKKAMAAVSAADYSVCFRTDPDFTREELSRAICAYYRERESIKVVRQTKKSERIVDLKPLIYEFAPHIFGDRQGFFLRLCAGSIDHVKPDLVLEDFYRFCGREYHPYRMQVHRLETYERTADGVFRPLSWAGDVITERIGEPVRTGGLP